MVVRRLLAGLRLARGAIWIKLGCKMSLNDLVGKMGLVGLGVEWPAGACSIVQRHPQRDNDGAYKVDHLEEPDHAVWPQLHLIE